MPAEFLFRQRTFFFSACCSGNHFSKTKTMKNFFFLLGSLLVSGFAFAQCEADHIVEASSFQYAPEVLNIEVGETVAFVNLGGQHDVNGIASSIDGMSFNNPEEFYLGPVMGGAEGVTHPGAANGAFGAVSGLHNLLDACKIEGKFLNWKFLNCLADCILSSPIERVRNL